MENKVEKLSQNAEEKGKRDGQRKHEEQVTDIKDRVRDLIYR